MDEKNKTGVITVKGHSFEVAIDGTDLKKKFQNRFGSGVKVDFIVKDFLPDTFKFIFRASDGSKTEDMEFLVFEVTGDKTAIGHARQTAVQGDLKCTLSK